MAYIRPVGIARGGSVWSDGTLDAMLIALWAENMSTPEIGRRLGISKNAAVGRAHRLGLPGKPSPIRRGGYAAPPRSHHGPGVARATGATLPPLPSKAAGGATRRLPSAPAPMRAPVAEAAQGVVVPCRMPLWGHKAKPTYAELLDPASWCGKDSRPGRSWCPACSRIVFTPRQPQEGASA